MQFRDTFNRLVIEAAQNNNQIVDPSTLDDKRVKKLLQYGVDLSGNKNSEKKKFKTDLDQMNLVVNGIRYQSIYQDIVQLQTFAKIYPGIDKATVKCWHVSNNSTLSKNFQQNQNNPKWIRSIGKAVNNIVKFEQTFEENVEKAVDTESNGYSESSKNGDKKDLQTFELSSCFIIFYADQSGVILKPANINDQQYKKMCIALGNIAVAMLALKFDTQGLQNLKTVGGKTIGNLGKQIVKAKAQAKAEQNQSVKGKFKAFLKDSFKLYRVACKESYKDFSVKVQTKPWGKSTLDKLIKIGNQQVKSGEIDFGYPDIEFVFGGTMSTGSQLKTDSAV